ncbi:hypothetical protein MTO96_010496 [Rhipicephalus appendiculatus]
MYSHLKVPRVFLLFPGTTSSPFNDAPVTTATHVAAWRRRLLRRAPERKAGTAQLTTRLARLSSHAQPAEHGGVQLVPD